MRLMLRSDSVDLDNAILAKILRSVDVFKKNTGRSPNCIELTVDEYKKIEEDYQKVMEITFEEGNGLTEVMGMPIIVTG